MDSTESPEGPTITFKPEARPDHERAKWSFNLTRFRENFAEWKPTVIADEEQPQDWWIASTAIPLVAATTAPMANLMSVVALVTSWRNRVYPDQLDNQGSVLQVGIPDPHWCIGLNASSLVIGVLGNLFLLFNFTKKMRYIIALPASICLWFLATGILAGIIASVHIYVPPIPPDYTYSQGYWSAVIAAVLYFILAVILQINMLGYMLGHYPQRFALTDDQRTLILQTTSLMIWLAVGAAMFQQLIGISFPDALYFSEVTVLTLGYGDITAKDSVARGLIFPYAVIGIIILALIVASITRFAREVTNANVVKNHLYNKREEVLRRSMTLEQNERDPGSGQHKHRVHAGNEANAPIQSMVNSIMAPRRSKTMVMREEKDRFNAMRAIQNETLRFRRWMSLFGSVVAFTIVWCGGAGVFARLEEMDYFTALYFGFCTLLTIGYGDVTIESNSGRPFFLVWVLVAIPTMTILISKMSDTIIAGVNSATNWIAEFTVLPTSGRYSEFISKFPAIRTYIERRAEKKRIQRGFGVGVNAPIDPGNSTDDDKDDLENGNGSADISKNKNNNDNNNNDNNDSNENGDDDYDRAQPPPKTVKQLQKDRRSPPRLARDLIFAIRRVTQDVVSSEIKRYAYEEWVEFTQLIRFTDPNASNDTEIELDENEWGLIEWDWMGENSPMMAEQTEPEWVLNRLTESLLRYMAIIETQHEGEDSKHHSMAYNDRFGSDTRAESSGSKEA